MPSSLIRPSVGRRCRSARTAILITRAAGPIVSAADGTKVAFFAKTSSWSHKGKAKHEQPMQGKDWTGSVEVDESTGAEQIQIGLPVLDGGKPIGSVVIGLAIAKMN